MVYKEITRMKGTIKVYDCPDCKREVFAGSYQRCDYCHKRICKTCYEETEGLCQECLAKEDD